MTLPSLPTRRLVPVVTLLGLTIALVVALVLMRAVFDDDTDDGAVPAPGSATPPAAGITPNVATPTGVPLADYDTTALTVQRAGFCDLIAPEPVEAALGGAPIDSRTYGNGESTALISDVTDIAAEYGCRWKRGRTVLRAWVFAPPVTSDEASGLVKDARRPEECAVRRAAPAFGDPSLARTCPAGKGFEASYRGLFGDAWLACSLTAPGGRGAALSRAEAWCVAVAEAASQPPS